MQFLKVRIHFSVMLHIDLHIISGLSGAIAFIASLATVSFMPVPDALCIIFARPVVTILLSAVFLGERLNFFKCFSGFLLLTGVVLVCQPPFLFGQMDSDSRSSLYYVGAYLALTACCTNGLMDVIIAKCEGVSTTVLVNWSAITGLVIAIIYSQFDPRSCLLSADIVTINLSDWGVLLGLAVSGIMASTTMTQALKLISPGIVASLSTLELPLAFTVQALISGHMPDLTSAMGGVLILSGVLLLGVQERLHRFTKELCCRSRSEEVNEYTSLVS